MQKELTEKLYELTRDLPVTDEYIRRKEIFEKEKEKFLATVGEEYRRKLEDLTDKLHSANDELNRQMFCEGCSIAVRFLIECIYKEQRDD